MAHVADQAMHLRQLAQRVSRRDALASLRAPRTTPRTIVVVGGKTRAGSTTVAAQLAQAAARDGLRVVLGDVDGQGGDLSQRMGVTPQFDINDILTGRLELAETLVDCNTGILLMPNCAGRIGHATAASLGRLTRDFAELKQRADLFVLDAGCEIDSLQRVFWDRADEVLIVSTPDSVSVLDAYATLKSNRVRDLRRFGLLVNRARDAQQAVDVHARLAHSSRRFLKTDIACRGWLPYSTALLTGHGQQQPPPHPNHVLADVFQSLLNAYAYLDPLESPNTTASRYA